MRRTYYLIFVLLIGMSFLVWTGCGSSKKTVGSDEYSSGDSESQDDYDEIERLLGITRDDDARQTQQKTKMKKDDQNDDLITLLEVDEGKKKDAPVQTNAGIEDKRVARLQSEVETLRKDNRDKDMEITDLKAQLALKEQEVIQLKQSPSRSLEYTAPAAGTYSASPSYPSYEGTDDYVAEYHVALDLFHNRQYNDAIQAFEQLLSVDTNHSYSDNAQYWIGECHYALGRYSEAIMAFEKVFTFRQSNKNDYAQFKIAQSYFKMGDKERASQEFQELLDNYPDSELVPRVRDYLAGY